MDINKANNIKKETEAKIEIAKKMTNNADNRPINKEQKKVIDELEEVLNFLKSRQIKDEYILVNIKKPLDDLSSSLKYIPTEPYFEIIPTEIKTNILSYLCDTDAFTSASVCLEWKVILGSRFTDKTLKIGEPCCSSCCTVMNSKCWKSSEMLKASATHKLDVHLSISRSVREVDPKLVTEGLTSVSKFSLFGDCTCKNESDDSFESDLNDCEVNPLSKEQLEDLFRGLEKKTETMEVINFMGLNLSGLNQDRLIHCFLFKIKNLTLQENKYHDGSMFNVKTLVNKLSPDTAEFKLNKLILDIFEYPDELGLQLANALCNVENVQLGANIPLRSETVTQLFANILSDSCPVKIKTLSLITLPWIDFGTLIDPKDLKKLFNKMKTLKLRGTFTVEQVEAARSLPDVNVLTSTFRILIIRRGA